MWYSDVKHLKIEVDHIQYHMSEVIEIDYTTYFKIIVIQRLTLFDYRLKIRFLQYIYTVIL